jgi:hypothetical protein
VSDNDLVVNYFDVKVVVIHHSAKGLRSTSTTGQSGSFRILILIELGFAELDLTKGTQQDLSALNLSGQPHP